MMCTYTGFLLNLRGVVLVHCDKLGIELATPMHTNVTANVLAPALAIATNLSCNTVQHIDTGPVEK